MFNILRIQHSFVLKMYVYNMNMYKRYVIKLIFVTKKGPMKTCNKSTHESPQEIHVDHC